MGLKQTTKPFSLDKPKFGETIGHHWKVRKPQNWSTRAVLIDTNRWKSRLHEAWATSIGDDGALSIFSTETDGRPADHRMYAEMQHAEYPAELIGHYGKMDVWSMRPGATDNEGLDTAVGAYVGLSMLGVKFAEVGEENIDSPSRTAISASEALQKRDPSQAAPMVTRTRMSAAEALAKR